jgi:hypothetical protein
MRGHPERSDDHFSKLDEAVSVFTGIDTKSVSNCEHLIGSHHVDNKYSLLYVTKRIMSRKGYLVEYMAQIAKS